MTREELEAKVKEVIHRVAPDAELEELIPTTRLREDLEIDSFDLLQVVIGLHAATGVEVPEADYDQLATFGSTVDYLQRATASAHAAAPPP